MAKRDKAQVEKRRAAREQRRATQRREEARRRLRRILVWGGVAMLFAGLIGWAAAGNLRRGPGERVLELSASHLNQGTKGTGYTSNPPTSGPHWPSPARWGVHTQVLPDEVLVHNLEHGGIWISYKDPKNATLAEQLAGIAERYDTKVIVTPRPKNDTAIAVAAWGRLLKLDAFDEAKIVEFIDAYRGKLGPEKDVP